MPYRPDHLVRTVGHRLLKREVRVMMTCTRAALRFTRFQNVRRSLLSYALVTRRFVTPLSAEIIVGEIERTRRRFGLTGNCLTAALVAEALFLRHGHEAVLCIGARREKDGAFEAHAWVERNNVVMVGGPREMTLGYTRFPGIPV